MAWDQISGQEHIVTLLRNGLRNDKLSHAYIFAGPVGTGRKQTALALAKAVYCEQRAEDSCGQCISCRKIDNGNHPEIHWIEPDGNAIKIEQIRELQQQLAYRSTESGRKIYILNQAERMTVQAANSLLKLLEEPLSPILAILITDNGQALLPTIRSRAQWLAFRPLSKERLREQLLAEGFPAELAYPAAELTAGIEAARALIQGNGFAETRNLVIQLVGDCLSRSSKLWITLQTKLFKTDLSENTDLLMDLLVLCLKDFVHIQFQRNQDVVYIDQANWLEQHAWSREPAQWIRCMEFALEARKKLRQHVNPQLALEQCLVRIQGV